MINKELENTVDLMIGLARENFSDKELESKIQDGTMGKIPFSKTTDLTRTDIQVAIHFEKVEIYWLMKVFYEHFKKSEFKVEKYFSSIEISKFELFRLKKDEKISEIKLENIDEIVRDKIYHCSKFSFEDIKISYNSGVVDYNYETQREAKYGEKAGVNTIKPTLIAKNVSEIKESMERGDFTPNTITWNLLDNSASDYVYNPEERTLTIRKSYDSRINIIDGYHRTRAIADLVERGIQVKNDFMFLTILHYDVEEAQKYIRQEQQGTKLSESQKKVFKNDRFSEVAKGINNYSNKDKNSLYGTIVSKNEFSKNKNSILSIEPVIDTIEKYYSEHLKNPRDNRKVISWVVEFMNEVLGIFSEEFENVEKSRKTKIITERNTLCSLIGFSEYFYGKKKEGWQDSLEVFLTGICFEANEKNRKMLLNSKRWGKSTMREIDNFTNILKVEYDNFNNKQN